jgi:CBS domain-containing protein
MNVSECMSRDVRICAPDHTVREAARAMKEIDAGALPVGENDRLVGMITDRDIVVRAIAEDKGCDTPVREAMTKEIHYVFEDERLEDAQAKMSELKVRRLPVLNRDKRLVGIVSLGDIWTSREAQQGSEALSRVAQHGGPHTQH